MTTSCFSCCCYTHSILCPGSVANLQWMQQEVSLRSQKRLTRQSLMFPLSVCIILLRYPQAFLDRSLEQNRDFQLHAIRNVNKYHLTSSDLWLLFSGLSSLPVFLTQLSVFF